MSRANAAERGGWVLRLRRAESVLRRRPVLTFSFGFALLMAALFFDPLFLHRAFTGRDLTAFFYPIEKAVHEQWRSVRIPLIIPELSWGKPLAANPNAGVFYPLRVAMATVPFPIAIKLFIVLHVWLAGVGAFLLARERGSSSPGSALSGLVFALGGPTLAETMYPDFLPGVALMPFVIWAALRLARRRNSSSAASFAAFWGAALLTGDVFTAGLALLGAALVSLEESPGRGIPALGRLALATVPGFLAASVQAVPALLLVPQTVRALGRFPFRVALLWSLSPWRLVELAVRLPFGNAARSPVVWGDLLWSGRSAGFLNTLYVGTIAAVAIMAARPARRRRPLPWGLGAFSLAAASAGFFWPEKLLGAASPIPLRYPEKLMVGFALSVSLLGAALVDRLRNGEGRKIGRIPLAVAALLAVVGAAALLTPEGTAAFVVERWTRFPAAARAAAAALPGILGRASVIWAIAALVLHAAGRRRAGGAALAALLAFAAFDLSLNRSLFVNTASVGDTFEPPATVETVRRLDEAEKFGYFPIGDYYRRPFDRGALLLDSAAFFDVFAVFNQDYDSADLYRVELVRRQIYRDSGRWPGLPRFLSAFSARSAVVETGRMPAGFTTPAATFGSQWVVVNPSAAPLIRYAPSVEEVSGPEEAWEVIRDEDRNLDEMPVVETGSRRIRKLSTGALRVLRFDAHRIEVETRTNGDARVVLPRAWSRYRTFHVDGSLAEAAATNLALTSVAVPAGIHRIRVDEILAGGATGPVLSALGIVVIVLLARSRIGISVFAGDR